MSRFEWRKSLRDSSIDSTAKLVALTLDTYASKDGLCWPSRQSIAHGASCDVRTVDQALRRLEARGYLVVERSKGRTKNRYWLMLPNSESPSPLASATATESRRNGGTDDAATANLAASNGDPSVPLTSSKRSLNNAVNGTGRGSIDFENEPDPRVIDLLERAKRGDYVRAMV